MDLADLPSPAWARMMGFLAPSDLESLLCVSRTVRCCTLRTALAPPRVRARLDGQPLTSEKLNKLVPQCPALHLVLEGPQQAPKENTALALELLRGLNHAHHVQELTLKGLHLTSLVPGAILSLLPALRHLALHRCHFQGDTGFKHQCVLDRIPQTWRLSFNDIQLNGPGRVADMRRPLTPKSPAKGSGVVPGVVRSTRSAAPVAAAAGAGSPQQQGGCASGPSSPPLSPPPSGPEPQLPTTQELKLCSISGVDTSARMMYGIPALAGHMTSLKLSDVLDFQDRIQYPRLIRLIANHMTQLSVFDTGDLYWAMRQEETEALLTLPCLNHLTVSGFELESSLADRPCRWKFLCCTAWDGFLHVPSLAYLPLHSLHEPLLITGGPLDPPGTPLDRRVHRLESDGGVSLCLGSAGRTRNDVQGVDVSKVAHASMNVMSQCGIRWRGVQRVLIWSGGAADCPVFPSAVHAVLPLLATCDAKLELAEVYVTPAVLSVLSLCQPMSRFTELTLFNCTLAPGAISDLGDLLPGLKRLTLTGDVYSPAPAVEDVEALLRLCRPRAPGTPNLALIVAHGWAEAVHKVWKGMQPLPVGVTLRVLAYVSRITPRGVFPFIAEDSAYP